MMMLLDVIGLLFMFGFSAFLVYEGTYEGVPAEKRTLWDKDLWGLILLTWAFIFFLYWLPKE